MLELKRIYWTRKSLCLGTLCAFAWFFAAAILAAVGSTNSLRPTSAIDILRPMFDAVLAAAVAPGLLFVVLVVVAVVIRSRDGRRRDPLRRFLPCASTSRGNAC